MLLFPYRTDGIGLSAPQVGVNVQLMVFNPAGVKGEGEEIILVNPVVYKSSKRLLVFEEGCLSFPGIYADVLVRIVSVPIFLPRGRFLLICPYILKHIFFFFAITHETCMMVSVL
jgi:hypothetical protein